MFEHKKIFLTLRKYSNLMVFEGNLLFFLKRKIQFSVLYLKHRQGEEIPSSSTNLLDDDDGDGDDDDVDNLKWALVPHNNQQTRN